MVGDPVKSAATVTDDVGGKEAVGDKRRLEEAREKKDGEQ